MKTMEGGCHCGRVRFRVTADLDSATICNCSICTKKGIWHLIVPPERFDLLQGASDLATYQFNTKVAKHHAVGARSSYGTFLKKARSTEWLTSEAKDEFRMQPKRCIDRLRITDLEISELNAEAASARKTADEFWINIDKTDVPFR